MLFGNVSNNNLWNLFFLSIFRVCLSEGKGNIKICEYWKRGERSINSKMNKSVPFSEIILKGKLELVSKAAKIRENIGVTVLGNRAKWERQIFHREKRLLRIRRPSRKILWDAIENRYWINESNDVTNGKEIYTDPRSPRYSSLEFDASTLSRACKGSRDAEKKRKERRRRRKK